MLATQDIQVVRELVRELQVRGEEQRARALQAVLEAASLTIADSDSRPTREYLTTGQAASVLGVSSGTIRGWVAAGRLAGLRRGRQTLVHRDTVQAELDRLLRTRLEAPTPGLGGAVAQRAVQRTLLAELPHPSVARLEALHERFEDGERLSPSEQAELSVLETEIVEVARQRLKVRIAKSGSNSNLIRGATNSRDPAPGHRPCWRALRVLRDCWLAAQRRSHCPRSIRHRWPDKPRATPQNLNDPVNLAAACMLCNRGKSDLTHGSDPLTGDTAPLINPRRDVWAEHLAWVAEYTRIVGLTPAGRVTVHRLRLNRAEYRLQRSLLRSAARAGILSWP